MRTILNVYKNYFNFNGKSTRMDYNIFMIFSLIVWTLLFMFDTTSGFFMEYDVAGNFVVDDMTVRYGYTSIAFFIISLIPWVSLSIRRLRDAGLSPYWIILFLVPVAQLVAYIMCIFAPSNRRRHPVTA